MIVVAVALVEVHDEGSVDVVQCVDIVQLLVRAVRQLRLAMETLEQVVPWRMKMSQMTRMHMLVRISDLIFPNHNSLCSIPIMNIRPFGGRYRA